MRSRRLKPIGLVVLLAAAIYVPAYLFGRGGVAYWSPDTFELSSQREYRVPLLSLPVYRSRPSHRRYELVDHLVRKGYWSPRAADDSRRIVMFCWNDQWKDGYHRLHQEFTRGEPHWLEWTEAHPDAASELWPQVLLMIRTWPNGDYWAAELMVWSRNLDSSEAVRDLVERLERTRRSLNGR